jgi:streptomycin 6-kinase
MSRPAPPLGLPPDFSRRVRLAFRDGAQWLDALPQLLAEAAERWSLVVEPPYPLSYNYVAPARTADGAEVVLKAGVPRHELGTEIDALALYAGRGAVRLLDADRAAGLLLLERLSPGRSLAEAGDDSQATEQAAAVMQALWRPVPPTHGFPDVADWAAGLARLRSHYGGGTGPFPPALVDAAEGRFAELLASQGPPVVLHGDLHHFNILAAGQGWRAIDPKGVVGEAAYEVGAWLRNPVGALPVGRPLARLTARRLDQLAELLALDRQRLAGWSLAQAVLSAWWEVEDAGALPAAGSHSLALAEALAAMR